MLLGNYSILHKSPAKYTTGTVGFNERSNWNKSGMVRSSLGKLEARPYGYGAQSAWMLPKTAGGVSTRGNVRGDGSVTGVGALGVNATALLDGSGTISNAVLLLVISAVANLSGSGALTASVAGKIEAAAALAGTGNLTGALSALANLIVSLSGSGNLSGGASGIGSVAASIKGYGDLTPEGIRDSVWQATAANFNESGTMGQKLNNAAAGGVDYSALASAVWAFANRTLTDGGLNATQTAQLRELFEVHGLDPAKPLTVTPTARTAGSINQTISGDGVASSTVTRV